MQLWWLWALLSAAAIYCVARRRPQLAVTAFLIVTDAGSGLTNPVQRRVRPAGNGRVRGCRRPGQPPDREHRLRRRLTGCGAGDGAPPHRCFRGLDRPGCRRLPAHDGSHQGGVDRLRCGPPDRLVVMVAGTPVWGGSGAAAAAAGVIAGYSVTTCSVVAASFRRSRSCSSQAVRLL